MPRFGALSFRSSDSIRAENLDRETEYMTHFQEERDQQGLRNRLLGKYQGVAANDATSQRRTRLGGMLSHDHRVAA
jgi:hypothetical protein